MGGGVKGVMNGELSGGTVAPGAHVDEPYCHEDSGQQEDLDAVRMAEGLE